MNDKRKLSDYDTLHCLRCDQPVKPTELKQENAVRYSHNCPDGNRHGWTIDADGDITNELTS